MTESLLTLNNAGLRHFGPFTLSIKAGERVAIMGPSGAGKSTLLRMVSGETAPTTGSVHFAGQPMKHWNTQQLSRRRAVLPQQHGVAFALETGLMVALGRVARQPDPARRDIVHQALRLACAGHLAGRRYDQLSGGEQARVHMARLFAQLWDQSDGLILVDEPLAALDPGLQFALLDSLEQFARQRGHALLAVLHDINHALASFDRLLLVSQRTLYADTPAGLAALDHLEQLFAIQLHPVRDARGQTQVAIMRRTTA